jgi:peptide chain release factor 1
MALRVLAAKLRERQELATANSSNTLRRAQVGSGMRGDKIRTYRTQDNSVRDHRSGQRLRLSEWQAGRW